MGGHGRAPARMVLMVGVVLVIILGTAWVAWSAAPPAQTSLPEPPAPSPVGTRLETTLAATITAPAVAAGPAPTPTRIALVRVASEAFGPLPPLDLPGAGPFGLRPRLRFERASTVPTLPTTADVYRLTWTRFTPETVRVLRNQLGLTGTIEELGSDAFQVQDATGGRLFIAHGRIAYSNRVDGPAHSATLDAATLAPLARRWLEERALYPLNAGSPRVSELPGLSLGTVRFSLAEPVAMVTPEPGIAVTLDAAGHVQELDWFWPETVQVASYPMADMTNLWEATRRGDAFVELDVDVQMTVEARPTGLASIDGASVAYALAGGGDAGETAFLEPVVVFTGLAWLDGRTSPVACRLYVPAVRDYRWPRG